MPWSTTVLPTHFSRSGGEYDPLPLDRHRLGTAAPQRVDHGLNAPLVDHQEIGIESVGGDAGRRVVQGDRDGRTGDRRETRRRRLLGEPLPQIRLRLPHVSERVNLASQLGHLPGELGVATGLRLDQADQIGVPSRAQVGAACVERADRDHQAGEHADGRRQRPTERAPPSIATPLPMPRPAKHPDDGASRLGGTPSAHGCPSR